MVTKICIICKIEKSITDFFKNGRGGYRHDCKECNKKRMTIYRNQNKDKIKEKSKEWLKNNKDKHNQYSKNWHNRNIDDINKKRSIFRQNNREKLRNDAIIYINKNKEKHRERSVKYRINNKEKINLYFKKRRKTDSSFKIRHSIRNLISLSLRRNKYVKTKTIQEILDCSYDEFILHLESQFKHWMTWENYGLYNGELNYGWDIDHIIPQSYGNTEEEIIKLNHYTNLQPLCSKVNRDIKRNLIK